MVVERRGIIESIDYAKNKVKDFKAIYKGYYSFSDSIFVTVKGKIDLNKDFIRLRIYKENNWPTKNFILVRKKTEWGKKGKTENVILKQEFDTLDQVGQYMKKEFGDSIEIGFGYSRKGWEYELGKNRIFIEDIEDFKPTVEIVSENKQELSDLLKKLEVTETLSDSVPEIMREIREK